MTIEERLKLLGEAENFYSDLSNAGEDVYRLGLRKAAALWTVKEWLELFKEKMLGEEDWTEKTLENALAFVLNEDYINEMIDQYELKGDEADFYMGWFGLAKSIMEWDEDIIYRLNKEQAAYDELSMQVFGYENLLSNKN